MNNKKGFTLAEILVALSLLVLVVFCFTPLMLASLKSVQVSGEKQQDRFEQKSALEEKLSDGIDYNAMDTTDNVSAVFSQSGKPDVIGAAEGKYLQSKDNLSESMFESFIAKDNASLVLSPSSVPENCKTGLISGTQVTITTDFINFEDAGQFYLLVNGSTKYENNTKIKFTLSNDSPRQATMQILAADLLRMGNTYQICYGSSGVSAYLQVTPPSLIVVGADGAYYGRNSEGLWQKGNDTLGKNRFNDVVWTGIQYVAAGENGAWWYTEEADGKVSWNDAGSTGATVVNGSSAQVKDLQISEQAGKMTAIGTVNVKVTWWGRYRDRILAQCMESASEIDVRNNWKSEDWESIFGSSNHMGYALADASIGGQPYFIWIYKKSGEIRTTLTPAGNAIEDFQYYKTIPTNGDETHPTGIAWNNEVGDKNEYVAVFANGEIFRFKPGKTVSTYNKAEWEADSNNDVEWKQTTVDPTIYTINYYSSSSRTWKTLQSVNEPQVSYNNKLLTISNIKENANSAAQTVTTSPYYSNETYVQCAATTTTHYKKDIAQVSGALNSVTYGNGTFIAVGDPTIKSISTWHKTVTIESSYSINNKGVLVKQENRVEPENPVPDNNNPEAQRTKIIYRDDSDVWKAIPATSQNSAAQKNILNKVEYIAGKFYAVGQNGTVLTSQDGINWQSDTAKMGDALASDKPNLYGIAGWGEN